MVGDSEEGLPVVVGVDLFGGDGFVVLDGSGQLELLVVGPDGNEGYDSEDGQCSDGFLGLGFW